MADLHWFGFSLDYTQTYIYIILNSASGTVARFKTTDGSIDFVKSCSLLNTGQNFDYAISMSPNSQIVFFSASDGTGYGYIWKGLDGSNNFDWAYYSGISPAETIVSVDSNVIYLIDYMITPENIEFRKLDFSNPSIEVWLSQIVWNSWATNADYDLYYDSDLLTVYALGKTYNNLSWSFVCLAK